MSNKTPLFPGPGTAELTADVQIEAAFGEGEEKRLPRFASKAYLGGPIRPHTNPPLKHPIVIDLATLDLSKQQRPVLKDHNHSLLVGHTDTIASDGRELSATGIISGTGEAAREVIDTSGNGYVWQQSIGLQFTGVRFVPKDSTVNVNGRLVAGPVYVTHASRLREISFLTLGADDDTSARIAAEAAKDTNMNFAEWLKARGFEEAALTDDQKTTLEAAFDATNGDNDGAAKEGGEAKAATATAEPDVSDYRKHLAAETRRVSKINELARGHGEIAAKAIEEGWSAEATELAVLKADRRQAPAGQVKAKEITGGVIEAAICQALGLPKVDEQFDEQTLDAAHGRFKGQLGLQQLLIEAAYANGYQGEYSSVRTDLRGVLHAAFNGNGSLQAAQFSTFSLPGILSNTANKFIMAAFNNVENAWSRIAARRPVRDFKAVTGYRLTGNGEYEQLPPDGEIKHGALGEAEYSNRAHTYAKMFALTRTDIINDDMGALMALTNILGRGAGMAMNTAFWTEFMDNAAFFTAGNGNYIDGADTVLSVAALQEAETEFMQQTDDEGQPIAVQPRYLVVPPALAVTARQLMNSTEIRNTAADTTYFTANPYVGAYEVVVSQYLSNASYTGNSSTAWYLVADPGVIPVIEGVFLNGRETPVIETAEADFNTLGIQVRGYHDFGFSKQEYRGGLKSKGAA